MMKKIITISIIMILTLCRVDTIQANSYGLNNPKTSNGVSTWDCVYFGSYPQASNGSGGFKTESIKWRVLSIDGNDAFLLADKVLDSQRYYTKIDYVTWSGSTIRWWLNESFYNTAFNIMDKNAINITAVKNEYNKHYNVTGGVDTLDKVYLLSMSEANNSKYGFDSSDLDSIKSRLCKSTDYAKNQGCLVAAKGDYINYSHWRLRTPGDSLTKTSIVGNDGTIWRSGTGVTRSDIGIRPALHINLKSDMWSHAGTVNSNGVETNAKTVNATIKKVTSKKKRLVIKWRRVYGVKGYNIQYSTSKRFKKAKTVNISKSSTTSKTIKKLKSKKKYFVRIRTYKTVSGKTYQSAWSKAKSKKTK